MPLSRGKAAAILAGVLAATAAGGVAFEYGKERRDALVQAAAVTSGDPRRGETAFIAYGCGGCHSIDHIPRATGTVGPALDAIALQAVIAGKLANTPDNVQRWIREPQAVSPGSAMPDLGVTPRDARDINAFLYSRAT